MAIDEDLLRDLDSDSESEEETDVFKRVPNEGDEQHRSGTKDEEGDHRMGDVSEELESLKNAGNEVSTVDLLTRLDMEHFSDITKVSKLSAKLRPIVEKVDDYMSRMISKKEEYGFVMNVNDISLEITNEQTMVHHFITAHYRKRFPELESLAPNMIEYARIVKTLQNNIEIKDGDLSFGSKEKNLVIAMAAIQAKQVTQNLTEDELSSVIAACDLLLQLQEDKLKIEGYLTSRLAVFAPNISAIVGPHTAAQLMSAVGGLQELVATPACNVAALGNRRTVGIGFGHSGIRQQGFLFYSDLIQDVSPDLRKQAMRITAAKIILAARVDHSNGSPDGALGKKWRVEIDAKIEKLEEPPENVATKALPVPEDLKAKKRGGRRYRKMRAKFEQSELRKAQDRVEFGKQESTVMDAFGEEIGLGMMKSMSHIPVNTLNKAKVSKAMKNRLEKSKASADDFFNQDLINLPKSEPKQIEGPQQKRIKR